MAEIKIAGTEYRIEPLSAKVAYELLAELLRLAGPAADHMQGLTTLYKTGQEWSQEMADASAYKALTKILNVQGTQAFVDFKTSIIELAQARRPSGIYEQVDLDLDFAGDLESSEKLYDFVMEVQFGNFSKGPKPNGPIAFAMQTARTLFRLMNDAK